MKSTKGACAIKGWF